MVRVVRTPQFTRNLFSDTELSGHMDGIEFTPAELKRRKKYRAQNSIKLPVNHEPVRPFNQGKEVS